MWRHVSKRCTLTCPGRTNGGLKAAHLHVATRVQEGAIAEVDVSVRHDDAPEMDLLAREERLPVPSAVFFGEELTILFQSGPAFGLELQM